MKSMLGCLFIILFGAIILFLGLIRLVTQLLFGKGMPGTGKGNFGPFGAFGGMNAANGRTNRPHADSASSQSTQTGNAHHGSNPNSRQKRSGKIFEKNEGKYVDFEEIH